jgi:hypothetical protein
MRRRKNHKANRSARKRAYYTAQFAVTRKNKARRAQRRIVGMAKAAIRRKLDKIEAGTFTARDAGLNERAA